MALAPLREAKDSLAKASTPEPFSTSRTSNWVARAGGLPAYIQHIAHDLMEKRGKTESNAIQMAIGIVKNWASGQGKVDSNTRAAAAKAVAEWEAMKGKNAAKRVVQHSAPVPSLADWRALEEQAILRVAILEQQLGIDALVWLAEASNTGMLGAGAAVGGGGGSTGSMGVASAKMSSVGSQHGLGGGKTLDGSRTAGSRGAGGSTVDGSKRGGGSGSRSGSTVEGGRGGGGYSGYVQHSDVAPPGALLEAEAFRPKLKRTASASGELERHEVHDNGQHVGTLCARSGMPVNGGSSMRWEARAINGERVTDYGNTSKPKALEALRKHLEEAPARVGRHGNGKYLVARPASYSGQDQYASYPTEAAARYAAGLPEQPSSPEKASHVQQLGEVLCFDLMTLSGVDIPPLRRVQEARRRDPFDLVESFSAAELRDFRGMWTRGGLHTGSRGRDLTPSMVRGMNTRTNRPKSGAQRRAEGGAVGYISSTTRQRLAGMFSARERAARAPKQPSANLDQLYKLAGARQKQFEQVMAGVQKAMGARSSKITDEQAFKRTVADVSGNTHVPHVIVAALKGRKRAEEKVAKEYGGDATKLTDLVRGTVLVSHVDDLHGAMQTVRQQLPKGWTVVRPKNRFVHEHGDRTNSGPLASGYHDINLLLRSPDGFHMELQLNTTHLYVAKEGMGGHLLYERRRKITDAATGRKLTAGERAQVQALDRKARTLYAPAMVRSLRAKAITAMLQRTRH